MRGQIANSGALRLWTAAAKPPLSKAAALLPQSKGPEKALSVMPRGACRKAGRAG